MFAAKLWLDGLFDNPFSTVRFRPKLEVNKAAASWIYCPIFPFTTIFVSNLLSLISPFDLDLATPKRQKSDLMKEVEQAPEHMETLKEGVEGDQKNPEINMFGSAGAFLFWVKDLFLLIAYM